MNRFRALGQVLALGGIVACGEVANPVDHQGAPGELLSLYRGAMDPADETPPCCLSARAHARAHQAVRDFFAATAASQSYPGVQASHDLDLPIQLSEHPVDPEADISLTTTLRASLLGSYCDEEGGTDSIYLLSGPASIGDEEGTLALRMSVRGQSFAPGDFDQSPDVSAFNLVVLEILDEAEAGASLPWSARPTESDSAQTDCPALVDDVADPTDAPTLDGNDIFPVDAPALDGNDTFPVDAPTLDGNDTFPNGAPALDGNGVLTGNAPALDGSDTFPVDAPALDGSDTLPNGAPALTGDGVDATDFQPVPVDISAVADAIDHAPVVTEAESSLPSLGHLRIATHRADGGVDGDRTEAAAPQVPRVPSLDAWQLQ